MREIIKYDIFALFIRSMYPIENIGNSEMEHLHTDFNKYLHSLNLSEDIINKIVPKSLADVLLKQNSPLHKNGFHPAFVLHFTQYIKENMQ